MSTRARTTVFICAGALPASTWAHQPGAESGALEWNLEPWIVATLVASLVFYARGVHRLWQRAGAARGISRGEVTSFVAGWAVLAIALLSPIDTLGGELFSMHMVQHELLMVVAAPLFVLARPLEAWAWGLPRGWAGAVAGLARRRAVAAMWKGLTDPVGAWVVHAAALWIWHIPPFFEAALRDDNLHALQHSTFLASALAFWWSVLKPRGVADAMGLASLFTTMLHTGVLGALLTFGMRPWYTAYRQTEHYGLTLLEDQQLGGLVMWVPGGLAYLAAGLVIAYGLLGRSSPASAGKATGP
jgi:putative membrane protein